MQHLVGWDGAGSKGSARCVRSDLGHFYDFSSSIVCQGTVLTSNVGRALYFVICDPDNVWIE